MGGGWLVEVIMVGSVSGEERMFLSRTQVQTRCLW